MQKIGLVSYSLDFSIAVDYWERHLTQQFCEVILPFLMQWSA